MCDWSEIRVGVVNTEMHLFTVLAAFRDKRRLRVFITTASHPDDHKRALL